MKTILELCRFLNSRHYFDDEQGNIGIYYCEKVLWYKETLAGWSFTGHTATPGKAKYCRA